MQKIMQNKGFVNAALVVLVVILVGTVGYLVWERRALETTTEKATEEVAAPAQEQDSSSSLELLFPKGGEKLEAGKTYQIRWSSNNIPPGAKIDILIRPPNQTEIAVDQISTQNTGSASWTAPQKLGGPLAYNCQIDGEVISVPTTVEIYWDSNGYKASDNSPFTITGPCVLEPKFDGSRGPH